jgi:hypothetical protein
MDAWDPIGEKAREVKARYRGVCRGCGASTSARYGKGDAYAYCKRCRPGAIARQWTRERVREAMRAWRARYGAAPSSYDWSRTHARRRGGEALKRLQAGEWPVSSTVIDLYAAPIRLRRQRWSRLGRDRSGACNSGASASAPSFGRANLSGAPNARLWRTGRSPVGAEVEWCIRAGTGIPSRPLCWECAPARRGSG